MTPWMCANFKVIQLPLDPNSNTNSNTNPNPVLHVSMWVCANFKVIQSPLEAEVSRFRSQLDNRCHEALLQQPADHILSIISLTRGNNDMTS